MGRGCLGLRPPPNQAKGTPNPRKGIPACSQHQEQATSPGQASSSAPRGAPMPRPAPHTQAWGYFTPLGQPVGQRGTDAQVTFMLITALAACPLPAQPPNAVPPQQPRKPSLRRSLSGSPAAARRGGGNLRRHPVPSSGAGEGTKPLQIHYSRTGGRRHHWELGYRVATDGDRGGKLARCVLPSEGETETLQAAAVMRGNGTRKTLVSINYSIKEWTFKNISLYTLYHINYACLFVTFHYIPPVNLRVSQYERGNDPVFHFTSLCGRDKATSVPFNRV